MDNNLQERRNEEFTNAEKYLQKEWQKFLDTATKLGFIPKPSERVGFVHTSGESLRDVGVMTEVETPSKMKMRGISGADPNLRFNRKHRNADDQFQNRYGRRLREFMETSEKII